MYIIYFIFIVYVSFLNYSKRIYDLLGVKSKAIFYTIAFWLINILISNINLLKYPGLIISLSILILLFVKQGKLVPIIKSECNTDEKENNNN